MYIYFVYFTIIVISEFFVRNDVLLKSKKKLIIYCSFITLLLILLSGLRNVRVGTDTTQYLDIWSMLTAGDFKSIDSSAELGFIYLQIFLKQYVNYNLFLLIVAALSLIPIGFIIGKYSKIYFYSFLLFYSSILFHTLEFAALRQALALSLIVLSFHYIMKRNLKMYVPLLLIAFFFHKSSIIFFPCYWLYGIKLNKNTLYFWIVLLIFSGVLSKTIFTLLNSMWRTDYSTTEMNAGGERFFTLTVVFTFIGLLNWKKIQNYPNIKVPFLIYMISSLLWPLLNTNPALYRLQYYFDFFFCLYVPNFVSILPKKSLLRILLIIMSIFAALYIILVMRTTDTYYPYNFFWEQ